MAFSFIQATSFPVQYRPHKAIYISTIEDMWIYGLGLQPLMVLVTCCRLVFSFALLLFYFIHLEKIKTNLMFFIHLHSMHVYVCAYYLCWFVCTFA